MSTQLNIERRGYGSSSRNGWNELSLPQQLAANELGQFGYHLAFVRKQDNESVAVMMVDDRVATIDEEGSVDTAPEIIVRG
jgi:hypothetical protein